MARWLSIRASSKLQLLWGLPGEQGCAHFPRKENWWTSDRVMDGQGSLIDVGAKGWPVYSNQANRLEYTEHYNLLRMWLPIYRPATRPMLTPIHRWMGVRCSIIWGTPDTRMHYWKISSQWGQCNTGKCSTGKPWVLTSMWMLQNNSEVLTWPSIPLNPFKHL